MDFAIDFLAHHSDAVAALAGWHYVQWSYLDRDVTLEQRVAALSQHGSDGVPLTVVALAGETALGSASLIQHDWVTFESTVYRGYAQTVMVRHL